jgi:hypothetical protein
VNSFHYDHMEDRGLVKKALSEQVETYFVEEILPKFEEISYETYWRKHAKWIWSAVKSSYFIYDDAAYWAQSLDPFTVIRFQDRKVCVVEVPMEDYDDEGVNPQDELIFDSWDDIMEKQNEFWEECSDDEAAIITSAIGWTGDVHNEMNEKIPLEEILKGDD